MRSLLVALILVAAGCDSASPSRAPTPPVAAPYDAANLFIGTGGTGFGHGSAFPGAGMPYGLVKLSPDTNGGLFGRQDFAHFGGYWYGDTQIEGFSHLHLHGTGAIDYGVVSVMPSLGMSAAKTTYEGYALPFTHSAETAKPGYYAVTFPAAKITAELTAAVHTGVHRYTFAPGADAVVILDLGHGLDGVEVTSATLAVVPGERRVFGTLDEHGGFSGRFGGQRIYVDAVFNRPWKTHGTWSNGALSPDAITATAAVAGKTNSAGAYFHFDPAAGPVELFVGVSLVSAADARANREAETAGKTFDGLRAAARLAWERELGRVTVEGGSADERAQFYAALYHAFVMPTQYSDVSGNFRTKEGGVQKAADWHFYSDLSLWDTYRTLHPLITLLAPAFQRDFVRSLGAMAAVRGSLPRWPMGTGDGNSMVGTPADIVVADSYLKGLRGFDAEALYAGMVSTAELGDPKNMREEREEYLTLGYCPADKTNGSVSVTLEIMYADFAIAQLARALGHDADAKRFAARAKRYAELWDPEFKFFRGKNADGSWALRSFDPTEHSKDYVEGTAWQYLWFVPWDAPGLVALFGGEAPFLETLDRFFQLSMETPPGAVGGLRLQDNYYWHGNEPDIHAAYLYTLAGHPEKAAPVIRWILASKYGNRPDGLDGNDDGGTLSSWYVWSAMGLYPLPAETRYLIGAPLFEKTTLNLDGGKTFTIVAEGASSERMYVRAALLNGAPLANPWLEHADVLAGGELRLLMSDRP